MCERTCPGCGSREHMDLYGVLGSHLMCSDCGLVLAVRADPEAASLDLTEDEVETWVLTHSGVLPGAEADDPADDEVWQGRAFKELTPSSS